MLDIILGAIRPEAIVYSGIYASMNIEYLDLRNFDRSCQDSLIFLSCSAEESTFADSIELKYQKNMAPKKSKVKKPKVKRSVAQPAKSIIERTICAHPVMKRVQKEVRELKKKSAKKHKK
ncbi:unnamed protein product [Bathycoccus prasinos]